MQERSEGASPLHSPVQAGLRRLPNRPDNKLASDASSAWRVFGASFFAGFSEVIRLDRAPFTKDSLRQAWWSGRSAFLSGFEGGMRLYFSPFTGFWREAVRLFGRRP